MDTLYLSASSFIMLSLLLTGGGARTENDCIRTANETIAVSPDEAHANIPCHLGYGIWRKGSDLCHLALYNNCKGFSCNVSRSDYINQLATYACCGSEETVGYCFNIIIKPILKVTIPPLLRAGEEETIFVVVTAKPRPSVFPSLSLHVVIPGSNSSTNDTNGTNSTNGTSDMRLTGSSMVATRPEEPLKYFIFYTLELPRIEEELAFSILNILPPDTWRINDTASDPLTYPEVNIIPAPLLETTTASETPEAPTNSQNALTKEGTPTTEGERFTPPTDGLRHGCMDGAIVVGASVGTGVIVAIASVLATIVIFWFYKRKTKEFHGHISRRSSKSTPNNLPLMKCSVNGHQPIIEPTPTTDIDSISLPDFTRLQSMGSSSPMTPMTEFVPLISSRHSGVIVQNEVCAAAAASGPKIPPEKETEMQPCHEESVSSHNFKQPPVESENDSDDSHHIYSEIKYIPPCKRPLPEAPPPFTCLRGQPAPFNPQTLSTLKSVDSRLPNSGTDSMDQSAYITQGNKIKLVSDLHSPESEV